MLLLGRQGERLVEHYSFYAVFKTPEEYRIVHDGKALGTLPIVQVMAPKMALIFSGRRWEVVSVEERDKTILVKPAPAGRPPKFGGDPGIIDDLVIQEMREGFNSEDVPAYLDETASYLLKEARRHFRELGLNSKSIIDLSEHTKILASWSGTVRANTLSLALVARGFRVDAYDGLLEVDIKKADTSLENALKAMQASDEPEVFAENTNLVFDKFHPFLNRDLLQLDAASSRLDIGSLQVLANQLVSPSSSDSPFLFSN